MSIEGTVQVVRTQVTSGSLLRRALRLDAVVTGASAVAYAGGAALLSDWFGVPALFLVAIGAFLAAYAVGVARLATRAAMPVPAVLAVIRLNAVWAVESLLLLAFDGFSPTF